MATDKNSSDVDTLRADIEALRNDVAAVTKSLGDLARKRADGVKDAAWSQAEHMRDEFGNIVDDLSTRGRQQVDRLEKEVADRPLFSLITAFGVGLLIGKLLDRR
jgi:ElaB/YqjD/DUF883 family membrane-anchored ribosome-binding protein